MGEDAILQIGAADLAWADLWWVAPLALGFASIPLFPWLCWRFRDWRIHRAEARGDHDRAATLALDHEVDEPPRSLRQIAGFALILIGMPALLIFQLKFADELEHMLGEGWGFAASMLTLGFVSACTWAWGQVRRNAMSPGELAELEEEEEHQRWIRSIDGDSMPGLFVALAGAAAILAAIYFLAQAITPG